MVKISTKYFRGLVHNLASKRGEVGYTDAEECRRDINILESYFILMNHFNQSKVKAFKWLNAHNTSFGCKPCVLFLTLKGSDKVVSYLRRTCIGPWQ